MGQKSTSGNAGKTTRDIYHAYHLGVFSSLEKVSNLCEFVYLDAQIFLECCQGLTDMYFPLRFPKYTKYANYTKLEVWGPFGLLNSSFRLCDPRTKKIQHSRRNNQILWDSNFATAVLWLVYVSNIRVSPSCHVVPIFNWRGGCTNRQAALNNVYNL